jgi:hypothetical protein
MAGLLQRSLAYDNSAVLFLKFTKPDDERHLQVPILRKPGFEPFNWILSATKPNGLEYFICNHKLNQGK